ncbi:hypothetical protein [Lysinibacillus sp. JNUCC 51]|uniref:hypothetical protein n=1 Tax=Lysinibacillus sp. JNUCC-51 TaxID=2792479 RepID=UPI0019352B09|nr:hypothetical protein JNUCC51_14430 [Lysinibacillus sp. JNUCC-51]
MNLKTAKEVIEELQVIMSHMCPEEKMKLEVWLKEFYIDEIIKKESNKVHTKGYISNAF